MIEINLRQLIERVVDGVIETVAPGGAVLPTGNWVDTAGSLGGVAWAVVAIGAIAFAAFLPSLASIMRLVAVVIAVVAIALSLGVI